MSPQANHIGSFVTAVSFTLANINRVLVYTANVADGMKDDKRLTEITGLNQTLRREGFSKGTVFFAIRFYTSETWKRTYFKSGLKV